MAQQPKLYEYDRLDTKRVHVRLLRVHALSTDCEPSISIQIFRLYGAPAYTALSYTWGEDKPSHPVCVRKNDTVCGVLHVSKNLLDFLRIASKHFERLEARWFWIDQISIDQGHNSERNHQVLHMASVFSSAEMVLIWLGPSFEGSSDLVADIRSYDAPEAAFINLSPQEIEDRVGTGARDEEAPQLARKPFKPSWAVAQQFLSLSWWSRLWVCQETVLARQITVALGEDSFLWDTVYWTSWLFNAREHGLRGGLHQGLALRDTRHHRSIHKHLERDWFSAVEVSKSRACAMPHDKFYGMLGMIRPRLVIPVDYGLPLVDVFLMVLRQELILEWDDNPDQGLEAAVSIARRLGKLWCSVDQAVNAPLLSIQSIRDFVFDESVDLCFPGPQNELRLQTIRNETGFLARIEASLLNGYDIVRNSDVDHGYSRDRTRRRSTSRITTSPGRPVGRYEIVDALVSF